MDEIKLLLAKWEEENYINPEGLKSAHDAIKLLIARVETLEEIINTLTS
jgi:hypothetical protein